MTGTFKAHELDALNALLRDFGGLIRHGKDYKGRKDPMHAEIVGSPGAIKALADDIRRRAGTGQRLDRPAPAITASAPQQEDDLRDDERAWLQTLYDQVTGNNFQGWPTWDGGTNESLSLVDYARRDNVETRQIHHNLASVHAKLDALAQRVAAVDGGEAPDLPPSLDQIPTPELLAELTRRMSGAQK